MRKICTRKMYKYVAFVTLLCCISFKLIISGAPAFLRQKAPKIDLLRGYCQGHENAPVKINNPRITKQNGVNYISGKLVVRQDNYTQFQVILRTKRCASKETLDSCEPLQDVTINRICDILKQTGQIWTPFIRSIRPPLDCPTKKGTYLITNGTFDVGPLVNFPGADDWYWRVQPELYQQGTNILVMCMNLEGQVSTL